MTTKGKRDDELSEGDSTTNLALQDNHEGVMQLSSGDALHKVGKQESFFDWIEKTYVKAKDAAAGVLLLLSRECGKSHSSAHLSIIVESIQLFTFALSPMLDADSTEVTPVETAPQSGSILENIVFFSDVSNLLTYTLGYELCLYLTVTAVIMILLNAVYVAYGWSNTFNVLWPIKVLRMQANVLIGLAFIPTIQLLALMFSCSSFNLNCTAWQPLVLVLSVFYILLAIAIGSTYFDPIMTSESPHASAHTRITVFNIFAKIVLSAVHAVWDSSASLKTFFAAELSRHLLLISFSATLSYLYIWYQPFYHHKMNALSSVTSSILVWFSVSMFVRWIKITLGDSGTVVALGDSTTSIDSTNAARDVSVALVTGVGLVIPLTIFLLDYRKRMLASKPVYRLRNAYEFELKIRNYLRDHHPIFDESRRSKSLQPLLKDNDAMNRTVDVDSSDDESDDEDQQPLFAREAKKTSEDKHAGHRRRKQDRVLTKVQRLFESAISQYTGSAQLPMFMIYFFKTFFEKEQGIVLSRKAILIAARRKPWFDLEFGLFKLQSEIKHNVSSGREVVSFVASEKYEREAKNYDRQSCWHLLEFWNELSVSRPDMVRVQSLAKAVAEYSAKAQSAYLRLTRLQPKQSRVLRLYSGFLNDVVNDRTAGQQAMSRAISYDDDRGASGPNANGGSANDVSNESNQLHKFDPVMVFEIGENTQHGTGFGEISYVNTDAAYVLQNVSYKLVGRSVMEYLIPPFSTHLRGIVAAFFVEGRSPLFGTKITTFCLSSRKDCFQVTMQLSPYTTDGINFTMFLSFVPEEQTLKEAEFGFGDDVANQGFFLFSNQHDNGHIIAASDAGAFLLEKFTTLLDSHPMLFGSTIELKDIIENSETALDAALSSGDFVDVSLCSLRREYEDFDTSKMRVEEFNYEGFRVHKVTVRIITKEAAASRTKRRGSSSSRGGDSQSVPSDSDDFSDLSQNESHDKFAYLTPTNVTSLGPPQPVKSPGSRSGSSVGSGKSGGSQSTVAGMYLRRLLQAEGTGKKMSPQLQRLSLVYVSCLLVVVACSLVYYAVQERNLELYASEVTFLNRAGFRRFNAVSLAFCTHALYLLNLGVVLPDVVTEETLRAEMQTNLDSLRTIEKAAFGLRSKLEGLSELYNTKMTNIEVLEGDGTRSEFTSLYDATSLITGAATNLLDSPLERFTLDNSNVYMVLVQALGENSYLQDLNRTTFLFQALAEQEIQSLVPFFWVSVGVSSLMQVLLLSYFIWPLVKLVERNKMEVLEVLKSIPPKSIMTISRRGAAEKEKKPMSAAKREEKRLAASVDRLETFDEAPSPIPASTTSGSNDNAREDDEDNDSDADSGFLNRAAANLDDDEKDAAKHSSNSSVPLMAWLAGEHDDDVDEDVSTYRMILKKFMRALRFPFRVCAASFAATRRLPERLRKSRQSSRPAAAASTAVTPLERKDTDTALQDRLRKTQTDMSAQLRILLKMGVPALAAFVFFVLNYTLGFYLNIDYLLRVPTSVNFSGLRRATLRLVKHMLFLYLAGTSMEAGEPYRAASSNVSHTMDLFEHVNSVLFRGADGKSGLLNTADDPKQLVLLLEEGCYDWPGADKTLCENFEDGVMAGGLMTATRQFLKRFTSELYSSQPLDTAVTSPEGYTLLSSDINSLLDLEENYLQVQYTTSVKLYVSEVTDKLYSDRVTRNIILAVYLAITFGVYIFLVRGIIRSLDNELKRTRRLLLMVPEELYNRLPTLRKFITREFKIGKRK